MNRLSTSCLTLVLWLISAPAQAEPLGRLFFTPQQRAVMNQQRAMQAALPNTASPTARLTINGEIHHGDGNITRWLNGEASKLPNRSSPSLAIGDTLDAATGERSSLLGAGQIRIHRPAAP